MTFNECFKKLKLKYPGIHTSLKVEKGYFPTSLKEYLKVEIYIGGLDNAIYRDTTFSKCFNQLPGEINNPIEKETDGIEDGECTTI